MTTRPPGLKEAAAAAMAVSCWVWAVGAGVYLSFVEIEGDNLNTFQFKWEVIRQNLLLFLSIFVAAGLGAVFGGMWQKQLERREKR